MKKIIDRLGDLFRERRPSPEPPTPEPAVVYRCECGWRGPEPKPSDQGPRCPLCGSLV